MALIGGQYRTPRVPGLPGAQMALIGVLLSSLSLGQPAADPTAQADPPKQAGQTVQATQDEVVIGVPWKGAPGITETVSAIMAREARLGSTGSAFVPETNPENEGPLPTKTDNPDSPAVASWPLREADLPDPVQLLSPQNIGGTFRA